MGRNFPFAVFGVALLASGPAWAESADTVFTGGKVYTVNEAQPWADAVAVKGNRIVYVGDAAGAEGFVGKDTKVIDTTGKTVLPGFVSAHDHLIASNWTSAGVNLFDAKSKEGVIKKIKEYADANPDHKVIKGIGWNVGIFNDVYPTAKELDAAVADRPAIILDYTIHDAWLNTKALEMGKVTKDTPDTLPGVSYWKRDEAGNPTGVAIEVQWMQAYIDIGAWAPGKMIRESTNKLFSLAARNGTTTVLNPGIVTPNVKDTHGGMEKDFIAAMDMLKELEEAGELKLRVQALPFFKSATADPQKFVDFAARMKQRYTGDKVMVRSVKIHPEGNWTAGVAPFLEPYKHADTKGAFNVKPEVSKAIVLAANKAGLDVVIHTDGDASSRAAVDAFEAAIKAGFRNRNQLHHLINVHPDDFQRIVDLKIPVNSTPSFTTDWSNNDEQAYRMLGKERTELEHGRYPDLVRAGNVVSISADVPSTLPSMQAPLYVMEAAVTMMEPSEQGQSKPFPKTRKGLTIEQAIRAMTINPAWQLGMENAIGSLEVGKYADIVVLEKNPLVVDPLQLEEMDVSMTMMDGKFTYQGDGSENAGGSRDTYLSPAEMTPGPY